MRSKSYLMSYRPRTGRRVRGTAEFEALVAAFFLLGIIFLGLGALRISVGRMAAGDQAEYLTWHDAYDTANPQFTNTALSIPISGADSLRSDPLPNRVHVGEGDVTVSYSSGPLSTASTLTLREIAMVPAPTWNLSATPIQGADQVMIQNWFEDYAQESIGEVSVPLGLDPYWLP